MKTIYTDKLGLWPWALLFISFMMLWSAYDTFKGSRGPFGINGTTGGLILALGGVFWLAIACKRILDFRRAKREGRDPTIIRVNENDS